MPETYINQVEAANYSALAKELRDIIATFTGLKKDAVESIKRIEEKLGNTIGIQDAILGKLENDQEIHEEEDYIWLKKMETESNEVITLLQNSVRELRSRIDYYDERINAQNKLLTQLEASNN